MQSQDVQHPTQQDLRLPHVSEGQAQPTLPQLVDQLQGLVGMEMQRIEYSRPALNVREMPEQNFDDLFTPSMKKTKDLFKFITTVCAMEDDTGEENPHNRVRISEVYSDFDQTLKNNAKHVLSQYLNWAIQQETTHERDSEERITTAKLTATCVAAFNRQVSRELCTRTLSALKQATGTPSENAMELDNDQSKVSSPQHIDCSLVVQAIYTLIILAHFETCVVYHNKFDMVLEDILLLTIALVDNDTMQGYLEIQNRPLVQKKLRSVIFCELAILGVREGQDKLSKYVHLGLEEFDGLAELWNVMAHMATLKNGRTLDEERQNATDALLYHERSIALCPRGSVYYMNRAILKMGKLYRLLHRLPHEDRAALREEWDSMPDFELSLKLNPHNDTALISRAREYKYRGITDQATQDYIAAVENCNLQKTYVIAYYLLELAELVDSAGDHETAARCFTDSLRFEDNKPRPYEGRAQSYVKANQLIKAYQDYALLEKMIGAQSGSLREQFRILRVLGQYEHAFARVNELFRKGTHRIRFPERALLYERFGEPYLAARNYAKLDMFETENGAVYRIHLAHIMDNDMDDMLYILE